MVAVDQYHSQDLVVAKGGIKNMEMTLVFNGLEEISKYSPREDIRVVALAFELLEQSVPFLVGNGKVQIVLEKNNEKVVIQRDADGKIRATIQ